MRKAMRACDADVTEILSRCQTPDQIERDLYFAVQRGQPKPQEPNPGGPPSGVVERVEKAAKELERKEDKATLTKLTQHMVDICDELCKDPHDAWRKYDKICDFRKQARVIETKYSRRGEDSPGISWDEVQRTDCGLELWNDVVNNHGNMCFGTSSADETANAYWFKGRAEQLNQMFHPPASRPTPRIDPGPREPSGGDSNCPPGCTCNGGRTRSCPVSPP